MVVNGVNPVAILPMVVTIEMAIMRIEHMQRFVGLWRHKHHHQQKHPPYIQCSFFHLSIIRISNLEMF